MQNHHLAKFFTEFEFCQRQKTPDHYWFPLLINAYHPQEAEEVRSLVSRMLQDGFTLLHASDIRDFREPMHSPVLEEIARTRQEVELLKMNLKKLQFTGFSDLPLIRLQEKTTIIPQYLLMEYPHTIYRKLQHSFLTTQLNGNRDFDKEFLILHYEIS